MPVYTMSVCAEVGTNYILKNFAIKIYVKPEEKVMVYLNFSPASITFVSVVGTNNNNNN